jgi:hypothetical protein
MNTVIFAHEIAGSMLLSFPFTPLSQSAVLVATRLLGPINTGLLIEETCPSFKAVPRGVHVVRLKHYISNLVAAPLGRLLFVRSGLVTVVLMHLNQVVVPLCSSSSWCHRVRTKQHFGWIVPFPVEFCLHRAPTSLLRLKLSLGTCNQAGVGK